MNQLIGTLILGLSLVVVTNCGSDKDKPKSENPIRFVPAPVAGPNPAPSLPNGSFTPVIPSFSSPLTIPPGFSGPRSSLYTYEFKENGISTGKHSFILLEAYCAGLRSRSLNNNNAAYSLRKAAYEAQCYRFGAFTELP